jgi:hypothetical protein
MPITPSIGLSVILHAFVILFFKITGRLRLSSKKLKDSKIFISNFVGASITITISVVILAGAFAIVDLCLADEHSSFRLVKEYADSMSASSSRNSFEHVALAEKSDKPVVVEPKAVAPAAEPKMDQRECRRLFSEFTEKYNWSVVQFLTEKGVYHSFGDLQSFASELAIEQYRGSSAQNREMMRKLFVKYNEITLPGIKSCFTF